MLVREDGKGFIFKIRRIKSSSYQINFGIYSTNYLSSPRRNSHYSFRRKIFALSLLFMSPRTANKNSGIDYVFLSSSQDNA